MAEVKLEEPEHLRRLRVGLETKAKEMKRQTAIDTALTMLGFVGVPAAITRQAASRGIVRGALEHIPSRKAALKWAKTQLKGMVRTPDELLDRIEAVTVKPLKAPPGKGKFGEAVEWIHPHTGKPMVREVRLNPLERAKPTTWPHEAGGHIMQYAEREAGTPSARAILGGSSRATSLGAGAGTPAAEIHAEAVAKQWLEALAGGRPGKALTMEEVRSAYDKALREALEMLGTKY